MVVQWNLRNPQGNEWNLLSSKIMKITLQAKDLLRSLIAIWYTCSSRCHKRWKIQDAKAAVDKKWKKFGNNYSMKFGKSQEQKKEVILKAQRNKKKVHFCHPRKCGVGTQSTDVPRQSRALGRHCKRRLWSLRSFYWTRLVCVSNDCSKSNGFYCKITRLWLTSRRRSVSLHASKIGGRSQIAQNSQIGMSRCRIRFPRRKWPKQWRKLKVPVVLERNLYGHPLAGLLWERQFEEASLELGWEKWPNWECLFVHRKQGLFLSVCVDDIKMAGKRQNMTPMWKDDDKCGYWRTHIISWPCLLEMYSAWMQTK